MVRPHPKNPSIALTAGLDGKAIIWDIIRGTALRRFTTQDTFPLSQGRWTDPLHITEAIWCKDGQGIILGDASGQIHCYTNGGLVADLMRRAPHDQFLVTDYSELDLAFEIVDLGGEQVHRARIGDASVRDAMTGLPCHLVPQGKLCDCELVPHPCKGVQRAFEISRGAYELKDEVQPMDAIRARMTPPSQPPPSSAVAAQGVMAQPQGVMAQPQGVMAQPQGAMAQPRGAMAHPQGVMTQQQGHPLNPQLGPDSASAPNLPSCLSWEGERDQRRLFGIPAALICQPPTLTSSRWACEFFFNIPSIMLRMTTGHNLDRHSLAMEALAIVVGRHLGHSTTSSISHLYNTIEAFYSTGGSAGGSINPRMQIKASTSRWGIPDEAGGGGGGGGAGAGAGAGGGGGGLGGPMNPQPPQPMDERQTMEAIFKNMRHARAYCERGEREWREEEEEEEKQLHIGQGIGMHVDQGVGRRPLIERILGLALSSAESGDGGEIRATDEAEGAEFDFGATARSDRWAGLQRASDDDDDDDLEDDAEVEEEDDVNDDDFEEGLSPLEDTDEDEDDLEDDEDYSGGGGDMARGGRGGARGGRGGGGRRVARRTRGSRRAVIEDSDDKDFEEEMDEEDEDEEDEEEEEVQRGREDRGGRDRADRSRARHIRPTTAVHTSSAPGVSTRRRAVSSLAAASQENQPSGGLGGLGGFEGRSLRPRSGRRWDHLAEFYQDEEDEDVDQGVGMDQGVGVGMDAGGQVEGDGLDGVGTGMGGVVEAAGVGEEAFAQGPGSEGQLDVSIPNADRGRKRRRGRKEEDPSVSPPEEDDEDEDEDEEESSPDDSDDNDRKGRRRRGRAVASGSSSHQRAKKGRAGGEHQQQSRRPRRKSQRAVRQRRYRDDSDDDSDDDY